MTRRDADLARADDLLQSAWLLLIQVEALHAEHRIGRILDVSASEALGAVLALRRAIETELPAMLAGVDRRAANRGTHTIRGDSCVVCGSPDADFWTCEEVAGDNLGTHVLVDGACTVCGTTEPRRVACAG